MTPGKLVRSLVDALACGKLAGNEERWFSRGVIQVELPNRFDQKGSTRDFEEIQAFNRRLERDCISRRFELTTLIESGGQAVAEIVFQLTFEDGALGALDGLRGNLALFSWLDHGRIVRQHLYLSFAR